MVFFIFIHIIDGFHFPSVCSSTRSKIAKGQRSPDAFYLIETIKIVGFHGHPSVNKQENKSAFFDFFSVPTWLPGAPNNIQASSFQH